MPNARLDRLVICRRPPEIRRRVMPYPAIRVAPPVDRHERTLGVRQSPGCSSRWWSRPWPGRIAGARAVAPRIRRRSGPVPRRPNGTNRPEWQ